MQIRRYNVCRLNNRQRQLHSVQGSVQRAHINILKYVMASDMES